MRDKLQGKGLLIHHWDTDGICSAKILLEYLSGKNIVTKTPELGNYFLTKTELQQYSEYDFVIIADMSLPRDNILHLIKNAQVLIFDHHLGEVIQEVVHENPVIKGKNPDEYPSASWIINRYLDNPVNLFALLGVVGDHEQKIKNNQKMFNILTKFCNDHNLTFNDMLKMVYLLDSNYKIGDKQAVEKAPYILLNCANHSEILQNSVWNENLEKLNKEIAKQLAKESDEINGTIIKRMNTPYNIISTITRKIAWDSGKNTLVVNTGFFKDMDQIYMRSNKNAESIIQRGKDLGFKCGGKKEVLGAVVPKEKTNLFVGEIMEFLTKN
jgi:single-stranded DNA-specific DHH superfamily exonuclease